MRHDRKSVGFRLAAVIVCGAIWGGGASAEAWELKSYGGDFVVDFPGVPTLSREVVQTPVGPIAVRTVRHQMSDCGFVVMYYDLPAEYVRVAGAARILESSRNGAVSRLNGRLLADTESDLAGFPGLAMLVGLEGRDAHVAARMFLVGNRMYVILATGNVQRLRDPVCRRFFDSFDLTNEAIPHKNLSDDEHYATPEE